MGMKREVNWPTLYYIAATSSLKGFQIQHYAELSEWGTYRLNQT